MKIISVLGLLLAFAIPVFAQDAFNYCAGTLIYTPPERWFAVEIAHTQYGASVHIASSAAALKNLTAGKGEAVIIVNAISRSDLAQALHINDDADLSSVLEGIATPVSMPITADSITPIKIGDQPAGRMEVHFSSADLLIIALDIKPDLVGLVSLGTPVGEIEQWETSARDVAESLSFEIEASSDAVDDCAA